MARNKKLELDSDKPGEWWTADKRFAVVRRNRPINPMEVTVDFKISPEYTIHSFEDYNGPREFPTLAPKIGVVQTFKEVFPWLGTYTGEGSFELGNPSLVTAKPVGGSRRVEDVSELLADVFVEDMLVEEKWKLNAQWIKGVKAWWKQWVKRAETIGKGRGELAGDRAIDYLNEGLKRLRKLKEDLWLNKGLWPNFLSGDEQGDRKSDSLWGKKNIAWDFDHAEEIIADSRQRIMTWIDAIYKEGSHESQVYSSAREKRYGIDRDMDALDAELAMVPEAVSRADAYISGKLFRRLNAFVNKWNPGGEQMDPFKGTDVQTEFSMGKMKVVFQPVTGGAERYDINALVQMKHHTRDPQSQKFYVKVLDRAKKMLERAGFGRAWYGVTWVVPEGAASEFKGARTGKTYREAAHWTHSDDIVIFSNVRQSNLNDLADTMVHEVGHRWYYKFMNKDERARFESYFGDVAAVSEYGSEKPAEDFAEVFEWYVTGKRLTRDQRERFKEFATKRMGIRRHEDVSQIRDVLLG